MNDGDVASLVDAINQLASPGNRYLERAKLISKISDF